MSESKRNLGAGLTAEERETIISWADDDGDKVFIHTTQLPMLRKLLKHPLFELQDEHIDGETGNLFGIDGYLPRKVISIRNSVMKRELSDEERKELGDRLRKSISSSTTIDNNVVTEKSPKERGKTPGHE